MASKTMLHPPNGSLGPSLGRQGSIYSLTLEEFQKSMLEQGKIGSMNMDEFLKNVLTAEESQAMVSAMIGGNDGAGPSQNTLQRQPSINIPRTLGQKTVDEVWKEIQVQKQQQQQQDLSFGEMTLEDFLVKAGVVKEDIDAMTGLGPQGNLHGNVDPMSQSQQPADWFGYQMKQQQLLQQQAEAAVFAKRSPVGNLILPAGPAGAYFDGSYEGGPLTPGNLALTPAIGTPDTPSKKRSLDLVVEKTVERRQRRMIKNRESAARSRARKQAYTVELEAEVTQLKEENMKLKRWQAEEAERRRKQIMEIFLPTHQQQQQRQQQQTTSSGLRRCRSLP